MLYHHHLCSLHYRKWRACCHPVAFRWRELNLNPQLSIPLLQYYQSSSFFSIIFKNASHFFATLQNTGSALMCILLVLLGQFALHWKSPVDENDSCSPFTIQLLSPCQLMECNYCSIRLWYCTTYSSKEPGFMRMLLNLVLCCACNLFILYTQCPFLAREERYGGDAHPFKLHVTYCHCIMIHCNIQPFSWG